MARRGRGTGFGPVTPEYRKERWAKCQYYIRRTKTLPDAKAMAKRDGHGAATSVWITAFAKLLEIGWTPSDR